MKKALMAAVCCAAALAILVGGYLCYAPYWQPGYAPVSPEPLSTEEVFRVDLNRATAAELQSIPGIGEGTARAILDYRDDFGGFIIVDQLILVEGISMDDVNAWREYLYIGE
ncbi:MAG TPA: helix-hairpin-helix domain-containing protein [Candidatus Fournierella merdavium]|uniref:ComEA family DNA-binding protein n=1 Tax=Candidatus Allofournierella merdavium TaxID=2838593 RepID=UPI001F991746|nr:helix-hairpin-helix domain-containing protein [Candidatus Fournierella merdavium]